MICNKHGNFISRLVSRTLVTTDLSSEPIEHTNNINNKLMSKTLCIKSDFVKALLFSDQITIHRKPGFVAIHARINDMDK